MEDPERDRLVAREIEAGRCPFSQLEDGQTMAHCPMGFPGCSCADEWMENPYLIPVADAAYDRYLAEEKERKGKP